MSNRVAYLTNDDITNDVALGIFYGELKLGEPVKFTHQTGKRWTDMLARTHDVLPFFSKRVVDLFEDNGFTGWMKYEIEVENMPSEINNKYYGFMITGRCENNLKTIAKERRIKNWDGSDFFTMNGTSRIFISERVYKCLSIKKHKLTNIEMESFDELLLYFVDEKAYFKKKFGL